MLPFNVKICGVTSAEDALGACDAGADAIGLNFYPGSSRYLADDLTTAKVRDAIGEKAFVVGVFVNENVDQVIRIAKKFNLDAVQLHGDENLEYGGQLKCPIIKAISVRSDSYSVLNSLIDDWQDLSNLVGLLLDTECGHQYGGSGKTFDWAAVGASLSSRSQLVLAGGLHADNVGQAISEFGAVAVDVASGVEIEKGRKNKEKMARFVKNARLAFGQTH